MDTKISKHRRHDHVNIEVNLSLLKFDMYRFKNCLAFKFLKQYEFDVDTICISHSEPPSIYFGCSIDLGYQSNNNPLHNYDMNGIAQ